MASFVRGQFLRGEIVLQRKLKALTRKQRSQFGRQALNRGLTVIARVQRRIAPVVGGSKGLKKAIGTHSKMVGGIRRGRSGLGVRKKMPKDLKDVQGSFVSARSAHLFILGTDERETKAGSPTGKIDPIPGADFIWRGYRIARPEFRRTIIRVLKSKIHAEASRR